MLTRPSFDTLVNLRQTLMQLENQLDPSVDAVSIAELKRIVVQRIAELEAENAMEDETATAGAIREPKPPRKESAPGKTAA